MSGLNSLSIIGNLGADAELKHTQGGTELLSMRVAVSERIKRGDKWEEETTWVGVAVFGNRAAALGRLGLTKGTKIYASGPAKARAYMPNGGNEPRASLDLIARELVLLGGGSNGNNQRNSGGGDYGSSGNAIGGSGTGADDFDDMDQVPF